MSVEMVVKKKEKRDDRRRVRVFPLLAAVWTICSVAWLMKRQPEKKALLLTLYESVYERARYAPRRNTRRNGSRPGVPLGSLFLHLRTNYHASTLKREK